MIMPNFSWPSWNVRLFFGTERETRNDVSVLAKQASMGKDYLKLNIGEDKTLLQNGTLTPCFALQSFC
jgi:hypothetical protein